MGDVTKLKALIPEWKLVILALENYKNQLDEKVGSIEDEDQQNQMYGDLEKLERMIPDFKLQVVSAVMEKCKP